MPWGADDEALLQAADDATATPVHIAYTLAPEWFDGIAEVIDELASWSRRRPDIAVFLIEHVIARLDAASVDDSDGGIVEALERLEPLHAAAASSAGQGPIELGERSVRLAHQLDIEPFGTPGETHGAVRARPECTRSSPPPNTPDRRCRQPGPGAPDRGGSGHLERCSGPTPLLDVGTDRLCLRRARYGSATRPCATVSHMEVSVRDLRNRTADVVAAVQAGQPVTLTSRGEPVADIVPHRRRTRWLPGGWLREQLAERQADAQLTDDLDRLVGQTTDEL